MIEKLTETDHTLSPDELKTVLAKINSRATDIVRDTGSITMSEVVNLVHDTVVELKGTQATSYMADSRMTTSAGASPSLAGLRVIGVSNGFPGQESGDGPGVWAG